MKMVVLGAGMQGTACAYDLLQNPKVRTVAIADVTLEKAQMATKQLPIDERLTFHSVDAINLKALSAFLEPYDVLISAVPYFLNLAVSEAAITSRTHMVDMGGNTDLVFEQRKLNEKAQQAGITILPDCGLAPGMANILAAHAIQQFDTVDSVKIRVGGLPQNPQPPLNYRLFFSIHGLINEYVGKSVILREGSITEVDTLTDIETLNFPDSVGEVEAFHTLGGVSTLPWTYQGQIKTMDYKTIRYPGHCHQIKTMHDLGLLDDSPIEINGNKISPREVFAAVVVPRLNFEDNLDLVLVRVEVIGKKSGVIATYRMEIQDRYDDQTNFTAMMRTTAFPVSIVAQMLGNGSIMNRGVLALEQTVPTEPFISELVKRHIHVSQKFKS